MVKKQQMQWSRHGAYYLLQTRTAVLNGGLHDQFARWHPEMAVENGVAESSIPFNMAA